MFLDPHISVVGIAGPFGADHAAAHGLGRGAAPAKDVALVRFGQAAQDIGALARLVVIDGSLIELKVTLRIAPGKGIAQAQGRGVE